MGREIDLTLFACPKPFSGHIGIIQRNAIASWTQLLPPRNILLLGDEEGVAEAARELKVQHIPHLDRTPTGTPLVDSLFKSAKEHSGSAWLAYINADIILLDDFLIALALLDLELKRTGIGRFLLSGLRVDVDQREPLDFHDGTWQAQVRRKVAGQGVKMNLDAIDLFLYNRELFNDLLPLAVGRTVWDSYLIWKARQEGAAIIVGTGSFTLIHQCHDYAHAGGWKNAWHGEEAIRNQELTKGCLVDMAGGATHTLTKDSLLEGKPQNVFNHGDLARQRIDIALQELENGSQNAAVDYLCDALQWIQNLQTSKEWYESLAHTREEWIGELEKAKQWWEAEADKLHHMVSSQANRLAELNTVVENKQTQIAELNTVVENQQTQIEELNTAVENKQTLLTRIQSTLWWKIGYGVHSRIMKPLKTILGYRRFLQLHCTIHTLSSVLFYIDTAPAIQTRQSTAAIAGWCFSPGSSSLPSLRVTSKSLRGSNTISDYESISRPDVAFEYTNSPCSRESGFSFKIPLAPALNLIRLEVKNGQSWAPLMQSLLWRSLRCEYSDGPPIRVLIDQQPWPPDRPLISVVIPCFNYGKYVEDAIDSVLNQTIQNLEIIVVDGGSTDQDTLNILRKLEKPKTRVYFRKGRHLAGDNRNFGINKAAGKYICCLDADDMLKPTYLEKALFIAENYNFDLVYPSVQSFGESDLVWRVQDVDLATCVRINGVSTVGLFKKNIWQKVGGYKDWGVGENHVHEDWEFWVRILGNGARCKSIPEPLMLYRVHGPSTSTQSGKSLEQHSEIIRRENKRLLTKRNLRRISKTKKYSFTLSSPNINLKSGSYSRGRILFFLPFMTIGGADSVLIQLGKHLCNNGFELLYITTVETDASTGDSTDKYEEFTKRVYHLPKFLPKRSTWKDFVTYIFDSRHIDAVFISGCEFAYDLLPYIKTISSTTKVIDQLYNEHVYIPRNIEYNAYIDMNIVASKIILDTLQNYDKNIVKKSRLILHGVDTGGNFNPDNFRSLANPFSPFPARGFTVSFFGRFSEEKQPLMFVEIAVALRDLEGINFLMIGNGPQYSLVKLAISDYGMGHRFCAPGFVEDMRPALHSSDIVIIPSTIEGVPIILLESLAMGKPVIASAVGGIPDIIEEGLNGFMCSCDDVKCFVERIKELRSNPELRKQISKNAREYAVRNLDIGTMKSKYLDAIQELLGLELQN